MDERACNGDTLHLSAGKLVRIAIAEAVEFHPGKPSRAAPAGCVSRRGARQFDVFEDRQRVQQLND